MGRITRFVFRVVEALVNRVFRDFIDRENELFQIDPQNDSYFKEYFEMCERFIN
jgi:hypothetical protein